MSSRLWDRSSVAGRILCPVGHITDWRWFLGTAIHIRGPTEPVSTGALLWGVRRDRFHTATQQASSTQDTVFQQLGRGASAKKKAEPVLKVLGPGTSIGRKNQKTYLQNWVKKWASGPELDPVIKVGQVGTVREAAKLAMPTPGSE